MYENYSGVSSGGTDLVHHARGNSIQSERARLFYGRQSSYVDQRFVVLTIGLVDAPAPRFQ